MGTQGWPWAVLPLYHIICNVAIWLDYAESPVVPMQERSFTARSTRKHCKV